MGVNVRPGVQEEVVAFVQGLRASRSHPSALPNALSVSNVTHAICVHFRTFAICGVLYVLSSYVSHCV